MKVLISIILFSSFLFSCAQIDQGPINKPNVLFILADDLGVNDVVLSDINTAYYETPNIRRIAQNGTTFTQGYSCSRVCSPSRASIMIGQYTGRHGITDWIGAPTGENWRAWNRHDLLLPADYIHDLPKDALTIAEILKEQNQYITFFAGKWHLGSEGSYPEDHGFDFNKGGWEKGSPIGGYFSPWKNPKLPNIKDGENLSIRLAEETVRFIQEHQDTNFLAFLSFYAVHGPIQTTKEKWTKYKNKAQAAGIADTGFIMEDVLPIRTIQDNPIYAGLLEQMDDAIGIVLDALEEMGLADHTMIVFTSDNGGVASGDAYATSNLPLRGGKGYQWEGGLRVPYIVKIPWLNAPDQIDYPATGADFLPTLASLTKTALPKDIQTIDGLDLSPLFQGKSLQQRSIYWHYPHYGNQGGQPSSIVRRDDDKLIHYWEDGRNEFFQGPRFVEKSNVNSDDQGDIDVLWQELNDWLTTMDSKLPLPDPEYDQEKDKQRDDYLLNELMPRLEAQRLLFLSDTFDPGNHWWGSSVNN